jgi:hypothetical protein
MKETCGECGARAGAGKSCQAIFDEFLALEFSDPSYGAVHFLTVACFMVQHGRYSDEGLKWIRGMLRRYFDEALSAEQLRELAGKDTSSAQRTWKVGRAPGAPPAPRIAWRMTIQDVAAQQRDAESYRRLVRQWARETLSQMEAA